MTSCSCNLLCGLLCEAGHGLGYDGSRNTIQSLTEESETDRLQSRHGRPSHPGSSVSASINGVILHGQQETVVDVRDQPHVQYTHNLHSYTSQCLHTVSSGFSPRLCSFGDLCTFNETMNHVLLSVH